MVGKILKSVVTVVLIVFAGLFCIDNIAALFGITLPAIAFLHGVPSEGAMMMMAGIVAPFPVDPKLTAISLAYRNNKLIADSVLPRKPVGKQTFKYRKYDKGTFISVPETVVSRTGSPNRVEVGFTEPESSTIDYGLDDPVPIADIENAPEGYDPLGASTEYLTQLVMLDREVRTAKVVFDTGSYATGNKITLSGTSQFSNAASDPIGVIQDAIDACFFRPNKMVMGRAVASKLFRHAAIIQSINGTTGDKGIAKRQEVAELFELDEIYIGEGWVNGAKPGQPAAPVRVWGKSIALYYDDPTADLQRGMTFGVTAQYGSKIAGFIEEKKAMGLRGGVIVRHGESVRELLLANDLGYLIDAAVA